MATALYSTWVKSGRSFTLASPVADLAATLRRYGYEVGTVGNTAHLTASTPEDHTPYSATGWPFHSPFGWVFALDIMPPPAGRGLPSLADLGAQLFADKNGGAAGAAPIKYMNWTPPGGQCRHDSWEPGHVTHPSSDVGHIHLSMRTDHQTSRAMVGYDPVAALRGMGHAPAVPAAAALAGAPAYPGRVLLYRPGLGLLHGTDVHQAQQRLRARGWRLTVDGWYGPQSASTVAAFQRDSSAHNWPLSVDGQIGPRTWDALWRRPVS